MDPCNNALIDTFCSRFNAGKFYNILVKSGTMLMSLKSMVFRKKATKLLSRPSYFRCLLTIWQSRMS